MCIRDQLSANALRSLDIRRFEPKTEIGVIKILLLKPGTFSPVLGIVGNQIVVADRGLSETNLHPISRDILRDDIDRILEVCQ